MNRFKYLLIICLMFSIVLTVHTAQCQEDVSLTTKMRKNGLALQKGDVLRIENHPHYMLTRKMAMVPLYPNIVKAVAEERTRMGKRFSKVGKLGKTRVENDALKFIEESFRYLLFPVWAGGKWSLGGRAKSPQSGPMACGYFLERMMKDLGFNIRPIKGYTMGQLATDEMMWSFRGKYQKNLRNWKGLETYLKSEGPGLYLVGISSRWGHVLFLRYSPEGPPLLYHSGPGTHGLKVQVDPAKEYIRDLMKPHVIHAAKINRQMAAKWLAGTAIEPVKCKTFGSLAARKGSIVVQAQRKLKRLGIYKGSIDGSFGPRTRSALKQFQKSRGLPVTLLPDRQTIKNLTGAVAQSGARTISVAGMPPYASNRNVGMKRPVGRWL